MIQADAKGGYLKDPLLNPMAYISQASKVLYIKPAIDTISTFELTMPYVQSYSSTSKTLHSTPIELY